MQQENRCAVGNNLCFIYEAKLFQQILTLPIVSSCLLPQFNAGNTQSATHGAMHGAGLWAAAPGRDAGHGAGLWAVAPGRGAPQASCCSTPHIHLKHFSLHLLTRLDLLRIIIIYFM